MIFTYYNQGEVKKIPIEDLLLQSKALRHLPLKNKEGLKLALKSGYWSRCQYEFVIGGLFDDEVRKMDVYELSLEPNIDVIWEYYQANKEHLDSEAEKWWVERRKMINEYVEICDGDDLEVLSQSSL